MDVNNNFFRVTHLRSRIMSVTLGFEMADTNAGELFTRATSPIGLISTCALQTGSAKINSVEANKEVYKRLDGLLVIVLHGKV